MLDRKFNGYEFAPTKQNFDRWKGSQFANAIRDENPMYYDIDEAKSNGFKDLSVPPTYFTKMTFSGDINFFFNSRN